MKGFELGTDDYLTKPFDPLELTVRVKALLKRYRIGHSQTIQLGQVTLDRQTYKIMRGKDVVSLPLKEFELLYKLAETPGQVYTREQLIDQIWGLIMREIIEPSMYILSACVSASTPSLIFISTQ